MSNKDIVDSIWLTTREDIRAQDVHTQCSLANDLIIKSCLNRKCLDNITCVIIAFENFEKIFESEVLHTYDGNVPYIKTVNTNRIMTEINLDNIDKHRNLSNRKQNIPISTKNSRPKLPLLEDMNNKDFKTNIKIDKNTINFLPPNHGCEIKYKNLTPLASKGLKDK